MRKIELSQLAVMNIHYQFYPLLHFFKTAQQLNISNVDLWAGFPHLLIDSNGTKRAQEIKKIAEAHNMNIICCTPEQVRYPINIASADLDIRKRTLDYLLRSVDVAEILGAQMLQIVPGYGYYDATEKTSSWDNLVLSMKELCKYAAKKGITVLLEPLQIIESNLVNDRFDAKRLVDDVQNDALKIVVDTTHMSLRGEKLEQYFELLGRKVGHIHLNESDQMPWGEGTLNLDSFLEAMAAYDYDRMFTLEICSLLHYVDADKSFITNFEYVKNRIINKFY